MKNNSPDLVAMYTTNGEHFEMFPHLENAKTIPKKFIRERIKQKVSGRRVRITFVESCVVLGDSGELDFFSIIGTSYFTKDPNLVYSFLDCKVNTN